MISLLELDRLDPRLALDGPPLLMSFNRAGIVAAADLHAAGRIGRLSRERDESVLLAIALTVRGARLGHVQIDLNGIQAAVEPEEWALDPEPPAWPEPEAWLARVARSPVVAVGDLVRGEDRPVRLLGSWLYLDRLWGQERQLASRLRELGAVGDHGVDEALLREGVERLFPSGRMDVRQRLAAASAVLRRFSVIAGGPGTGKTTTVARVVALLDEQALGHGRRLPLVALAAPTGKAAARLAQAVHEQAAELTVSEPVRDHLRSLSAFTIHRLLGRRPDSHSRFRHDSRRRLPHDVVIVDESSMMSLPRMVRLLEALRPQARLVLVGDPGQLTSIEAGAVLGDIVGPAAAELRMSAPARERLAQVSTAAVPASDPPPGITVGDGIVVLDVVHRYGGAIAQLAEAVRLGDGDRALEVLAQEGGELSWISEAPDSQTALDVVRVRALAAGTAIQAAAERGDAEAALRELARFRILCAQRRGAAGARPWNDHVESWLTGAAGVPGRGAAAARLPRDAFWYLGRPLLITENDYELGLFNGDSGVVVAGPQGRAVAAFERRGQLATFAPSRLGAVETVYAMTIHKSQGSQFSTAAVLLPEPDAPILTRELLYTALTRATQRLIVIGGEAAVRAAIARPVARGSGLRRRLWESAAP